MVMVESEWGDDGPLGFRPLLRMVVAADFWARPGLSDHPRAEANWPGAFLTMAEAWAAGHGVGPPMWASALETMSDPKAQGRELVALIVATPMLLVNANPQGHRRSVIQDWGQHLGLSSSTLVALDHYFQLVGQRGQMAGVGGDRSPWMIPSGLGGRDLGCPEMNPSDLDDPNFNHLVTLVISLQGQSLPALTLAHRWGWPSAALALVGVLSVLRSGPGGLPLDWLAGQADQGDLGPRWRGYEAAQIDRLADALYGRWAGSPIRSPKGTPIMARDSGMA